jgi:hypothetical protein
MVQKKFIPVLFLLTESGRIYQTFWSAGCYYLISQINLICWLPAFAEATADKTWCLVLVV